MQINAILARYQDNLEKIINKENIPISIKGKAGVLKRDTKKSATEKSKSENIYNVNIKTNHGTVYGDVFNNNDSSRVDKRQKVVHVNDKSSTWNINNQEDVWDAVQQYLKKSIAHEFCLEKYHIIKCGYSIKCDPSIPEELWSYFKDDGYTIPTPFQTCSQYATSVLTVMKKKNELKAIEEVVKSLEITEEIACTSQNFVKEFFYVCLYIYRRLNLYDRLSINETSFNHSFIWLIMKFVVDSIPDITLKFSPGEYILKCSNEEYKADACISTDENELSILETSAKILLNDSSKYGCDYVKIHYGALSIFNAVYKKYYSATEATASKLHISFLHARRT